MIIIDWKDILFAIAFASGVYSIGKIIVLILSMLMECLEEHPKAKLIVKCIAVMALTVLIWRIFPYISEMLDKMIQNN